ncbi:MAG TPA: hypothetical protein PLV45_08930 [bacterium]|nr:hypothetical protein [bacterium]
MSSDITMKIGEVLSLKRRMTADIEPDYDVSFHMHEESAVHFARAYSADACLVMDTAVVPVQFECFNAGAKPVGIEGIVFSSEEGHEIQCVSDTHFPVLLDWQKGVQEITVLLMRPPLEPGLYHCSASLRTAQGSHTNPVGFDLVLEAPKKPSVSLILHPKRLEISSQTMVRILNGSNPAIGTVVLFNPTSENCHFTLHSDSGNLAAHPENGVIPPGRSMYISIAVSPSHGISPGGAEILGVTHKTEQTSKDEVVHVVY